MGKQLKAPVTIAIGLLCENSIIAASDSQMTMGGNKDLDAEKITAIKFKGSSALVAQAGGVAMAARALGFMQDLASGSEISDEWTVANTAQEAIRQLRELMARQQNGCTQAELNEYIDDSDLGFGFLVAHYFRDSPFVFSINLRNGVASVAASARSKYYAAIGSGSALAMYLLKNYTKPQMPFNLGYGLVSYVVEEVKINDTWCSGSTSVATLSPGDDEPDVIHPAIIHEVGQAMVSINQSICKERNVSVVNEIKAISGEFSRRRRKREAQNPKN